MTIALPATDEARRLAALRGLELLDTPAEPVFDGITRTLARALRVPMALVSLVDEQRQWFKSRVGLDATETDRCVSFCTHTIAGAEPLVVADARDDARFRDNPLVAGAPHIRFYAGVSVEAPDGSRIGTLCVVDTEPRELAQEDLTLLRDLADQVNRELRHRQAAIDARSRLVDSRRSIEQSEALFRSVFELAAMGVAIVGPDGRFLRVNRALAAIVGYTPDELLALSFQHITHPADLDPDLSLVQRLVSGEIDHYDLEKRYITKSGEIVWIHLTVAQQRNAAGETEYFISLIENISARKKSVEQIALLSANLEVQVAERTRQLQRMVESAELRNEQLRTVSEATALLTAASTLDEIAAVMQQFMPLVFPAAAGTLYLGASGNFRAVSSWGAGGVQPVGTELTWSDCWALRRGEEHRVEDPYASLICAHRHHRRVCCHSCVPVFAHGEAVGLLELEWVDATGERTPDSVLLQTLGRKLGLAVTNIKLREELRLLALRDPLTGLYNRRYFDDFIERRLAEYRRDQNGFAVLVLDLDHFKAINDNYGHDYGDVALLELASLLSRATRTEDAAFRFGGEEFVVVIRCRSAREARMSAERIRASVGAMILPPPADGRDPARLTVSIGVACCPEDAAEVPALLRCADEALYAAKNAGRDRVCEAAGLRPGQPLRQVPR